MSKKTIIIETAMNNPTKKNVARLVELCESLMRSNAKLRKKLAETRDVALAAQARWNNMEWEIETGRRRG